MVAGKVTVSPKPAAGPLMATMVGLVQLAIARATRPPLCDRVSIRLGQLSSAYRLVSISGDGLFAFFMSHQPGKSNLEICSRTEGLPGASQNNSPNSLVLIDNSICRLKLSKKILSDSIMLIRTVKG